jgi:hypothetical protein
MILITTQAEFQKLVEELRGMATAAPTAKIRDALTKIADRYAARAADAERRSGNHRMRNSRAAFAQVTAPPTRASQRNESWPDAALGNVCQAEPT